MTLVELVAALRQPRPARVEGTQVDLSGIAQYGPYGLGVTALYVAYRLIIFFGAMHGAKPNERSEILKHLGPILAPRRFQLPRRKGRDDGEDGP